MSGAIVLHSGGQDSTTCLVWAIEKFGRDNIKTVAFDYGQRHDIELLQAQKISDILGVQQPEILPVLGLRQLGAAALTNNQIEPNPDAQGTGNVFAEVHDLPSTFVPGRNLLFLTLAAAYGAKFGIYELVTGVCQADAAGYPDCRESFIVNAGFAISSALADEDVMIHTPLLHRTKQQTFHLAYELGVLDLILEETHTCYQGDRSQRHRWGYGCGECGACKERAHGYDMFITEDPA